MGPQILGYPHKAGDLPHALRLAASPQVCGTLEVSAGNAICTAAPASDASRAIGPLRTAIPAR